VASEALIKEQCGPRTKIVAHPCFREIIKQMLKNGSRLYNVSSEKLKNVDIVEWKNGLRAISYPCKRFYFNLVECIHF